jgi:hypothetical protein
MVSVKYATDDGILDAFPSKDIEDRIEPEYCDCEGYGGWPVFVCGNWTEEDDTEGRYSGRSNDVFF